LQWIAGNQCSFIFVTHAPEKAPPILPEGEGNLEDRSEYILELKKTHSPFLFPLGRIGWASILLFSSLWEG
jgi:hypothetical protein